MCFLLLYVSSAGYPDGLQRRDGATILVYMIDFTTAPVIKSIYHSLSFNYYSLSTTAPVKEYLPARGA